MTIEMKYDSIFRAAHVVLPDQAATFSQMGSDISASSMVVGNEIAKTGHSLSRDFWRMGEEITHRLTQVTRTMNDSAVALDRIAADFMETDADAASWLDDHAKWLERHPGLGSGPSTSPLPESPTRPGPR